MPWRGSRSSSTSSNGSGATAPPEVIARRRRLAALAALVLAALIAAALVALLGGGGADPRDALVRLAPPDTLLWVAADTSPSRAATGRGARLAGRFPGLRALPARLAATLGLRGLDVARDVRPWLGDAAAVAIVPSGTGTAALVLAGVRDRPA
jgi:hypothetical protein